MTIDELIEKLNKLKESMPDDSDVYVLSNGFQSDIKDVFVIDEGEIGISFDDEDFIFKE